MKQYKRLFEYDDDEDEDLSEGDLWLKEYTLNPYNKYPSKSEIQELLQSYPCTEKENVTYLRGINFNSIEEFEIFKKDIIDNKIYLVENGICSFTLDKRTALNFATTRPMYLDQMDKSDLDDLAKRRELKAKQAERYDGYKGIIIGVKAENKKVIDVNKSPYVKENEYLLTPGKYKIVYLKLISKFKDVLDKGLNINKFVKNLTLKSFSGVKADLLKYIVKNNLQVSDESKHILFNKLLKEIKPKDIYHKVTETYDNEKLIVYYDRNIHILLDFDFLWLKEDYEKLIKLVNSICKNIYEYLKNNNLFTYSLYDSANFRLLNKYESPYLEKIKKQFNLEIGKVYNKLNSKEEVDKINKLSGKEQMKAINNLVNDMLKNFNKVI